MTPTSLATPPVTILLVDDDKFDKLALRRGFRDVHIVNQVVETRSGVEALDVLRGTNGHDALAQPCLVVLDLNMPRMGGLEFLEELRNDPALRRTLIFVMTTSADASDVNRCYDKNVAGYTVKTRGGEAVRNTVAMLQKYCTVVAFPN
jgi:CheY-like chemotaxis protein